MKKLISLLLVVCLLLSITACTIVLPDNHSNDDDDKITASTPTNPAKPDPTDPEPTKPDPSEPEPTEPDPSEPEPTNPSGNPDCEHLFDELSYTEPTCTEFGHLYAECSLCGAYQSITVAPTGHQFDDATCTEAKTCQNCGITEGDPLGHHYVSNTCDRCGDVLAIVIKVWTPTEDQSSYNNWLVDMEEQFMAAHPEWNIQFENATNSESDAAQYVINDPSNAADVYMFPSNMTQKLVKAGGLLKLTDAYADQIKKDNNYVMERSIMLPGYDYYGFPVTGSTFFMYYDKNVFTEDDIKSLDTMLEKGSVYLPLDNAWMASSFFLGCGGELFPNYDGWNYDGGIKFDEWNGGYKAAKKMIELVNHPNFAGQTNYSDMLNGSYSAVFTGAWEYERLKSIYGDRLGVAMLPTFTVDGYEYQMRAMSYSICVGVNPYSNSVEGKQEICLAFASFLASEEAQLARYEANGTIPTHINLRNNNKIMSDPLAVAQMDTISEASEAQPGLTKMDNYWSPVSSFLYKIIDGDINMDNYKQKVDALNFALNGTW